MCGYCATLITAVHSSLRTQVFLFKAHLEGEIGCTRVWKRKTRNEKPLSSARRPRARTCDLRMNDVTFPFAFHLCPCRFASIVVDIDENRFLTV